MNSLEIPMNNLSSAEFGVPVTESVRSQRREVGHATIIAAKEGSMNARTELYETYNGRLTAFCASKLNGESGDAVQDVWEKALRGLEGYKNRESDFGAWLFTIARNRVKDYQRAGQVKTKESFDMATLPDTDPFVSPEAAMMRTADQQDSYALLENVLMRLSDDQRIILIARYLGGFSVRETAGILGKSENCVKVLTNHGLNRAGVLFEKSGVNSLEDL